MSAPTADAVEFRPSKPFRIPWGDVTVWLSGAIGLFIGVCAVLVLAHRGPGPLAPLPASRGMDLLALGFLVGVGPVAFRNWAHRRRLWKLDERLPDFLSDLAALHKAGLTLPAALVTASKGDYGPLSPEVRMAADQVRWNIPVLTAVDNLRARLGTPIADRTLTVVLEAGRTGGNLPEVMDIAAKNARTFVQLREQRVRELGLYTIIIYVASAVFIGVALALQEVFVPKMLEAFGSGAGGGLGLASKLPTADEFRGLFYSAALVQAFGNGLVGGLMSEGRSLAGLRHAWFIVLLTALGFAFA
ncbi:MAG TPA: type II secretion system F family protein [Candidatus Thermoplasmatota archaeon]|nr:type II secretion system F family protein [Candidatus Thermoplasmatota archaeon]